VEHWYEEMKNYDFEKGMSFNEKPVHHFVQVKNLEIAHLYWRQKIFVAYLRKGKDVVFLTHHWSAKSPYVHK
jgi:hypothetical protein